MKIIETIGAIILAHLYFIFWLLGETKEDIEARSEKTLIFSGGHISELNNELGFNRVFIKLAGDEKDLKLLNTAVINSLKK